jgi:ATP-binding cassette subfamily B multidrug efflux pump
MFTFFERLLDPFPSQEPTTPPNGVAAFCLHYCKGAKRYIFAMGIFTAIIAILEVSLYSAIGTLVDWLGTKPENLLDDEGQAIVYRTALTLLALPIAVFVQTTIMHQTLLGNFPMIVRWLSHRLLLGQSMKFYYNEFSGRLATKVMQTSLSVRETVMKLVDVILYVVIYFLGTLALVFSLDWRFGLPFAVWFICYLALLKYFLPRLMKISEAQADARSTMTGRIVDTYTNISTVKLFSHSTRETEYARDSMNGFLLTVYPQMRLATMLTTLVWTNSAVLIFSLGAMGLWLWGQSIITAGALAAAAALVMRLNGMSHWVMWEVSMLFENIGTVRDGMNTLTAPREVQDKPDAKPLQFNSGAINLDRIRFAYDKKEPVIRDLNLQIAPGEKIGLVGRSGAGKSTLVNLLLRFYDLDSGRVTIDGQDISQVAQNNLRHHIGMVTQDTSLLHRSIRENLRYGKPDASDEDILAAARKASAEEFILSLEDSQGRKGLDAHVGERGVKLSGGQKQRIAIARVLLKNAPILILDEATSALDSEVEGAIQENLKQLMEGKTVIAIAHRLSTIAELDRLIVLDAGNIIEQGSHAELVNQNGIYAKLWARQSGGFLAETVD